MHDDISQGRKTNPARYHQIHESKHFFGENNKAQSDQTDPKRGEKLQENVPVKQSYQCRGWNGKLGKTEVALE